MPQSRLLRLLALCLCLLPLRVAADQVTVFAAASLKTALDALAPGFKQATGHDLASSFAGSSVLARQIEYGAPADVFLSANTEWMDALEASGLIQPGSRIDLLGNSLVLIGPAGAPPLTEGGLSALENQRLAMALVDAVPAGIYGKAALQSLGLWDTLTPHVVQTDNVRAALALVALGEAPYGITYASDTLAEPRVATLFTFPKDSHPAIVYPAARLTDTPAARAFMDYLTGPQAAEVFIAQGFTLLARP